MEETVDHTVKDIEENKAISALAYLGLLVLVPLLAKKESPYAQFHAKQGLVLLIAWIAIWIVAIIPILGWIISIVGSIVLLVFTIMGLINALSGQMKELPLIGKYGGKFNL